MTITVSSKLGSFKEVQGKAKKNIEKRGAIIRTGDIIRFGRVPIMIKESSYDSKKIQNIRHQEILASENNAPDQNSNDPRQIYNRENTMNEYTNADLVN